MTPTPVSLYVAARALWPRHPTRRIVGPVAVEPDHAPFDPVGRADYAGVLTDRVIDRVLEPIGDKSDGAAEPARYRVRWSGPVGDLAHLVERHDRKLGVPEATFLLGETCADLGQCIVGITGRQHTVIAGTAEVEVELEEIGRRRWNGRQRGKRCGERQGIPVQHRNHPLAAGP